MRSEQLIVLVEADEATRVTLEVVLKHEGWTVLTAPNTSGALELIREDFPGLLIVDVASGGSASSRLIRTLRSEGSKLPILALGEAMTHAEVLAMGADDVLDPTSTTELVKKVRQLIGRA